MQKIGLLLGYKYDQYLGGKLERGVFVTVTIFYLVF